MSLIEIAETLRDAFDDFVPAEPVTHTYNPLKYGWKSCKAYLDAYGTKSPREVLMIGMNPGPWGMAQTAVPFGDVAMVRDWMGIEEEVEKPDNEHPKRLVEGFQCGRSEVSGTRLWTFMSEKFDSPEDFFDRFFVWNYCPLSFMEETGRNFIPEKLPKEERDVLFKPCDEAVRAIVDYLEPTYIVGVGKFAEKQAKKIVGDTFEGTIGSILHPSPASPKANRGWAQYAEEDFAALGIEI